VAKDAESDAADADSIMEEIHSLSDEVGHESEAFIREAPDETRRVDVEFSQDSQDSIDQAKGQLEGTDERLTEGTDGDDSAARTKAVSTLRNEASVASEDVDALSERSKEKKSKMDGISKQMETKVKAADAKGEEIETVAGAGLETYNDEESKFTNERDKLQSLRSAGIAAVGKDAKEAEAKFGR